MRPNPRVFTVSCRGFEELRHAAPQTGERSLWQCQCKVATAVVSVYISISTSLFLISPFYLDFILHLILVFTYYFPFSSLSHTLTHIHTSGLSLQAQACLTFPSLPVPSPSTVCFIKLPGLINSPVILFSWLICASHESKPTCYQMTSEPVSSLPYQRLVK